VRKIGLGGFHALGGAGEISQFYDGLEAFNLTQCGSHAITYVFLFMNIFYLQYFPNERKSGSIRDKRVWSDPL
jgi:hypothetical protein